MDAIIALAISAIGQEFCNMNFCTLFTLISVANTLCKDWINYTNDKTARR